jgi:hypothetical protein
MVVKRRYVQGAYISAGARDALRKEAIKRNIFTTTLVSEILEKKAKELARKERKGAQNNQI